MVLLHFSTIAMKSGAKGLKDKAFYIFGLRRTSPTLWYSDENMGQCYGCISTDL